MHAADYQNAAAICAGAGVESQGVDATALNRSVRHLDACTQVGEVRCQGVHHHVQLCNRAIHECLLSFSPCLLPSAYCLLPFVPSFLSSQRRTDSSVSISFELRGCTGCA